MVCREDTFNMVDVVCIEDTLTWWTWWSVVCTDDALTWLATAGNAMAAINDGRWILFPLSCYYFD